MRHASTSVTAHPQQRSRRIRGNAGEISPLLARCGVRVVAEETTDMTECSRPVSPVARLNPGRAARPIEGEAGTGVGGAPSYAAQAYPS